MSESVARATRRELRRAMGAHAVDTVSHQQAQIAALSESHNAITHRLNEQHQTLDDVRRFALALEQMTLTKRLRWLLTGSL